MRKNNLHYVYDPSATFSFIKVKHIMNTILYLFWINQEKFPYVYFFPSDNIIIKYEL